MVKPKLLEVLLDLDKAISAGIKGCQFSRNINMYKS